ncbi:MAG: hypothetical protein OXC62_08735 [Aestuariivita sp.]|nr:hypothetical protein [Aestuariivita sp.]
MAQEITKSYDNFINKLWAFESDVDPAKQAWYNENWTKPVAGTYPLVSYPGRVKRDPKTGEPLESGPLTVQQLFFAIGLKDFYDPSDPSPDWKTIQSNVINYLGFVGFQFQESDLNDLGYYNFPSVAVDGVHYPSHYVDVPTSHWENGVTQFFDTNTKEVSTPTVVTDVVCFYDEYFTGKNGVTNVLEFKNPEKHILIIKDHFDNKYANIISGLTSRGKNLSEYLNTYLTWDGLTPSVTPPPGRRTNKVEVTLSGLLAGAHLRGAEGVVSLLVDYKNSVDENGTYILQYVQDYAGYQTPFLNSG